MLKRRDWKLCKEQDTSFNNDQSEKEPKKTSNIKKCKKLTQTYWMGLIIY